MEEETGLQDSPEGREATGTQASKEAEASAAPLSAERRSGPTWRGWVLSILVAIALSVTATLLLGGSSAFRSDRPVTTEAGGYGAGRSCCPPADIGR
jgi:Na+(H+)/acetate symporter ActP